MSGINKDQTLTKCWSQLVIHILPTAGSQALPMGIHFIGYDPETRIYSLRWRPPRPVYAELCPRHGIHFRIRRGGVSRGPSPSVDPSSGHVSQRSRLRSVLRVSHPTQREVVNDEQYRQPASDVPNVEQHAAPNTSHGDPRLVHRGDSVSVMTTPMGPMQSTERMGAGDSVASDSDDVPPLEDLGYGGNDSWSMDQSQYLANYAISQVNRMNYAIAHPTTVVLRDVFLDIAALDADFMWTSQSTEYVTKWDPRLTHRANNITFRICHQEIHAWFIVAIAHQSVLHQWDRYPAQWWWEQ